MYLLDIFRTRVTKINSTPRTAALTQPRRARGLSCAGSSVQIGQRPDDGYINATAMCQAYYQRSGKRRDVNQWLCTKRTQESVQHLSKCTEIPVDFLVVKVVTGENDYRGTYIHPRLAIRFAVWLDDDFGYMVETWVMDWLTNQHQPVPPENKTVETPSAAITIADIPYLIQQLAALETELILALGHCKTTHAVVEQKLVDMSMNKIIDMIAHQQRTKLELALGYIAALRSTILSIEAAATAQTFQQLAEEIEILRTQKNQAQQQLAVLKESVAAQTSQHKISTNKVVEIKQSCLSKQERISRYLDYLETLPSKHIRPLA